MSWGFTDNTSSSVIHAPAQFKLAPNTANRDALFGNTTPDAFISGQTVGMFGVSTTEMGVKQGPILYGTVTDGGSGYSANATVTLSIGGVGDANATITGTVNTSTGKIESLVVASGGVYNAVPTISLSAPTAQQFDANTSGVVVASDFIIISPNVFEDGDRVTYTVATGNTALTPLASGSSYYVVSANTTGVKLAATPGGTPLDLAIVVSNEAGHSLTGETATGIVVPSLGTAGVAHAGWVVRTVGSGGRAGRVQYETLVAGGSMASDASDDTILPDA